MQQVEKNEDKSLLRLNQVVKNSKTFTPLSTSAATTTTTNASNLSPSSSQYSIGEKKMSSERINLINSILNNNTTTTTNNNNNNTAMNNNQSTMTNLDMIEPIDKSNQHDQMRRVNMTTSNEEELFNVNKADGIKVKAIGNSLNQITDERVKFFIEFAAGAIGGGVSRTATAPIDRLRTVFQVKSVDSKDVRVLNVLTFMIKEGNWQSLWRGNWVNVLKTAPENAIRLACYEKLKHLLNKNNEFTFSERVMCGSTAGLLATLTLYPLKTVKTIMNLGRTGEYASIVDCIRKTYRAHGFGGFYKGLVANSIGIIPSAGIDLATYETLKKHYSRHKGEPSVVERLILGSVSSCVGNLVVYPLFFARTRLQSNVNPNETTLGVLMHVWRRDGIVGCYRGFLLHIGKIGPAASISYVTFETVTKAFSLNSLN